MERMNVELMISRVKIDKAEWREAIMCPLIERHKRATVTREVDVIAVGSRKKLRSKFFNLR